MQYLDLVFCYMKYHAISEEEARKKADVEFKNYENMSEEEFKKASIAQ